MTGAGLPDSVAVREVGLRDGLQSLGATIATDDKLALASALAASRVTRIEVTSFVRADIIPQTADAPEVMAGVERGGAVAWEALVANLRGAQRALDAGVDAVVFVVAASEAFNLRNVGMTVERSLASFDDVAAFAAGAGVPAVAVVATAFGCPYEGDVAPAHVLGLVERLVSSGAGEVFLGDTVGMADPLRVETLAGEALARWPSVPVGLHLHDTRGMGLANVVGGLRAGVATFDASVGGLGGCPFAPVASGNISTEDTVHMLESMGIATGVDLDALIDAARLAERLVGATLPGQVMKSGPVRAPLSA